MELSPAVKNAASSISFMGILKIGLALLLAGLIFWLLNKFHVFHSSAADKIHEEQDKQNAIGAAELDKEVALDLTGTLDKDSGVFAPYGGGKEFSNQYHFSVNQYISYAKQIYDAKGAFHDNEDEAIAAFTAMPSKYTIRILGRMFMNYYNKDLLEFIKTFMNDAQLAAVNTRIKAKPDFLPWLPKTQELLKKKKVILKLK
jgi:hypothetical protein